MEELSKILWRLSREIINIVNGLKEAKKIGRVKTPYVRGKVTSFEYREGNVSLEAETVYFEKDWWDWKDRLQIIEPEIKKVSLYPRAYELISDIYGVSKAQAESWLSRFDQNVVRKALSEYAREESLLSSVILFLNDLEGNPISWNVSSELEGVWLMNEEVEIYKGLKIRRPQPKDFEFERPFYMLPFPIKPIWEGASAIIEMRYRAESQSQVWDELERLIIALRLYKIGSIARRKTVWKPRSVLRFGSATRSHRTQPIVYKYSLASDDSQKLQTFLNKVKTLIPVVDGRLETIDHISIALQRYNNALFKPEPAERLAHVIMGLEALFLKPLEREGLTHKLAQRTAKCLSVLGYQPQEVYDTVKDSYDVRSQFLHGSLVGEETLEISKLAKRVLEFLRSSILIFLELRREIKKETFLTNIDNALLHQNVSAKLEKSIKEYCSIGLINSRV